ncbi:hypothetical protein HY486_00855 [Candidatus Woesearchaeota archaeon]|nr:hypothetical protein [Candidatus Woesearchaeota archaeon]
MRRIIFLFLLLSQLVIAFDPRLGMQTTEKDSTVIIEGWIIKTDVNLFTNSPVSGTKIINIPVPPKNIEKAEIRAVYARDGGLNVFVNEEEAVSKNGLSKHQSYYINQDIRNKLKKGKNTISFEGTEQALGIKSGANADIYIKYQKCACNKNGAEKCDGTSTLVCDGCMFENQGQVVGKCFNNQVACKKEGGLLIDNACCAATQSFNAKTSKIECSKTKIGQGDVSSALRCEGKTTNAACFIGKQVLNNEAIAANNVLNIGGKLVACEQSDSLSNMKENTKVVVQTDDEKTSIRAETVRQAQPKEFTRTKDKPANENNWHTDACKQGQAICKPKYSPLIQQTPGGINKAQTPAQQENSFLSGFSCCDLFGQNNNDKIETTQEKSNYVFTVQENKPMLCKANEVGCGLRYQANLKKYYTLYCCDAGIVRKSKRGPVKECEQNEFVCGVERKHGYRVGDTHVYCCTGEIKKISSTIRITNPQRILTDTESKAEKAELVTKESNSPLITYLQQCTVISAGNEEYLCDEKFRTLEDTEKGKYFMLKKSPVTEANIDERTQGCCQTDQCWDGQNCINPGQDAIITLGASTNMTLSCQLSTQNKEIVTGLDEKGNTLPLASEQSKSGFFSWLQKILQ